MTRRLVAIFIIFLCAAGVWFLLGSTMLKRTEQLDERLRAKVVNLWGKPQVQQAPRVYYQTQNLNMGKPIPIASSDIHVDLKLEPRRKGLLWYATYQVTFDSRYRITNSTDGQKDIFFEFTFPRAGAVYYDLKLLVGGKKLKSFPMKSGRIVTSIPFGPGETQDVQVQYVSQGLDSWTYSSRDRAKQVTDFNLNMTTNFNRIDFPDNSISPNKNERTEEGRKLTWKYDNLMSGVEIGMVMPQKLNPGPLVSQVTFWAPVSLFMFFFLITMWTTVRDIKIHPVNYFFMAAAFFSFHLLIAYLVDHVSIHLAFILASIVSVALVVSYMKLVVNKRFAYIEVAISQLVYLVLFSYTFFFKGYRGLAITILCIVTLFITMQITGKIDWDEVLSREISKKSSIAPEPETAT